MTAGEFSKQRITLHKALIESEVISWSSKEDKKNKTSFLVVSFADGSQPFSREVSERIVDSMENSTGIKLRERGEKNPGQTSGMNFEAACTQYLRDTFPLINHLRPGPWIIEHVKARSGTPLARFEQYRHLFHLEELASEHADLNAFLGNSYTISPDIIIAREPNPDDIINGSLNLLDSSTVKFAALRRVNHGTNVAPILHANISCKFTMRSDRSQNSRTEALSVIRNRKGRTPHIVAVAAEPTPSRLASLALGTGDIDCVYHIALFELIDAVDGTGNSESIQMLDTMVQGKRLKDISDLPLDLAT